MPDVLAALLAAGASVAMAPDPPVEPPRCTAAEWCSSANCGAVADH